MTNKERFLLGRRVRWGLGERRGFEEKAERAVGRGENKAMEMLREE